MTKKEQIEKLQEELKHLKQSYLQEQIDLEYQNLRDKYIGKFYYKSDGVSYDHWIHVLDVPKELLYMNPGGLWGYATCQDFSLYDDGEIRMNTKTEIIFQELYDEINEEEYKTALEKIKSKFNT